MRETNHGIQSALTLRKQDCSPGPVPHVDQEEAVRQILAALVIILCSLAVSHSTDAAIPASQRSALEALYASTNGDFWNNNSGWLGTAGSECSWRGVECDESETTVTALYLAENNLTGSLPPEITQLPGLVTISMWENSLTGSIPPSIGALSNLRFLYLEENQLSGMIPSSIGNLMQLEDLRLWDNQLTGQIPPELGSLGALTILDLSINSLTGAVPTALRNLTSLRELVLHTNQLTGSIPPELGELTSLQVLIISINQLTGEIPGELAALTELEILYLNNNELTGSIPSWLGSLSHMRRLSLHTNRLTGSIPPELGNLTELDLLYIGVTPLTGQIPTTLGNLSRMVDLQIWDTQISGPIPTELGNLTNLERLWLNQNQLSGEIPVELGNLQKLTQLGLYRNRLTGEIPPVLGTLTDLQLLYLWENQLTGTVPPEIGNLTALQYLDLADNDLTGDIPPSLGDLPELLELSLFGNQLTGEIPPSIGNLGKLEELSLSRNKLSGTIPDSLASLESLRWLYLHVNELSGTIPPWLGELSNLEIVYLWGNKLQGVIPPEIGNLENLQQLILSINQLSGVIPPEIGNLENLQILILNQNRLTGSIPVEIGDLAKLEELSLHTNQLSGSIPTQIGNLTNLRDLRVSYNRLDGPIPDSIGNLAGLEIAYLGANNLSGALPASLGNLANMKDFEVWRTRVSGPIPPEIGGMTALEILVLETNNLSGSIPPELGNLKKLNDLELFDNSLTGPIPPELGNATALVELKLDRNRLSGPIPPELGGLFQLEILRLERNALTGEVPAELQGMVALADGQSDLGFNRLVANDPDLEAFLDAKQLGGNFSATQTVPPTNVSVVSSTPESITLRWTPIEFSGGSGGYRIGVSTNPVGPFDISLTTASKQASSAVVGSLSPGTTYHFQLSTISYASATQKNTLVSETAQITSGMTAPAGAEVVVISSPAVMTAEADGESVDTTAFSIANFGQIPTTITLSSSDAFFEISEPTIELAGGTASRVVVTSLPQSSTADLRGSINVAGTGVPDGTSVPIALFATPPAPEGNPNVIVEQARVDVSGPEGVNPAGSALFRNIGTATATGILGADQPWIVPETSVITIEPGESKSLSFTIDRSRRPDAASLSGTQLGTLSFVYVAGTGTTSAKGALDETSSVSSLVGVGDTVTPDVELVNGIPLLEEGQIGLVIPGVGNVTGSVGVFISDLTVANGLSGLSVDDLNLFYSSAGETYSASEPVSSGQSLALADVVATVFGKSEQIGVIHARSEKALELAMNASVFNKSNPTGTYGTAIPVFRTDRAAEPDESLWITGLRKTATSHTNLYLQEVLGVDTTVQVVFLGASGEVIGVLPDQPVAAFGTTIIGSQFVPEGAVTARVENSTAGGVVSYATPVDRASGDTWAVADWGSVYGMEQGQRQIIPVAGSAPGRNDTNFLTDISIANRSAVAASATLRYYQQAPTVSVIERSLELDAGQTVTFEDVVGSLFEATRPSLGHVELVPSDGSELAMSSRTYTTVTGSDQTFGTGVPALPPSFALRRGQSIVLGGLEDSTAETTNAGTPATFRTNLGLVEVDGAPVTVKVSVLLFSGKQLVAVSTTASKTISLAPREFRQLNAIVSAIIGTELRESSFGEFKNIQARVDIVDGDGAVIVYATQTDNGTGDTVLRLR